MSHCKKTTLPDLSSRQAGQCVLAQGGDYNRTSFLSNGILHFNVTKHPTSAWIIQQLREAFPGLSQIPDL
jgi:hypothetical protein